MNWGQSKREDGQFAETRFWRTVILRRQTVRAIAGALVVLAGAVLAGAGVVAHAVAEAANKFPTGGDSATVVGGIVGLTGLVILVSGLLPDAPRKP